MSKYFCIFGGGGIRGAAYTGAIRAINELNIEMTGLAGSSIGAVVAGLYSFGYSADEIQDVFNNSINLEFFNDLNLNFGKDFALSTGNNFYEWMKCKLEDKFYHNIACETERPPITFKDLDKELIIFSVDLASSKLFEFSKFKTPDVEIAHAIRISVAMPGLYRPVFNANECLADGDLSKSMPLFKISDVIRQKSERILELRLENNETKKKITNTLEYLNAVYDSVSGIATDYLIDTYKNHDKYDMVKINTQDISVVDFMISKEKKTYMAQTGYETLMNYFKNVYPIKKKKLFDIYNGLLSNLQKTVYFIKNKDIQNARYEILNIAASIVKEKEIIDKNVTFGILNLKELFDNLYVVKKGLFGSKAVLADSKKFLDELSEVEKKLILKTGEFA